MTTPLYPPGLLCASQRPALGFALGLAPSVLGATLFVQSWSSLPALPWATSGSPGLSLAGWLAVVLALVLLALSSCMRRDGAGKGGPGVRAAWALGCALLAIALVTGSLTVWRAQDRLADRLHASLEGERLTVIGRIDALPFLHTRGPGFRLALEACVPAQGGSEPSALARGTPGCLLPRSVQLSWNAAPGQPVAQVRPGERWQFEVVLRRPHASLNFWGFDRELRWLHEDIGGLGTVRNGIRLTDPTPSIGQRIERWRDTIRAAMLRAVPAGRDREAGVLVGLAIGDQAAIAPELWQVFNRTGVSHLMSISGLHITMLSGMAGMLAGFLWRRPFVGRMGLPERLSAQTVRMGTAVLVAFAYSHLAGWGVPAQRTCWMLAVAAILYVSGRHASILAAVGGAATVVVLMDPWAPLTAGFWLSFGAVLAIVWVGSGQRFGESRLGNAVRTAVQTQWAASLALVPLGVWLFGAVSFAGPVANAVAIPLVSILITPLALAGGAIALVSEAAAFWPLAGAAWLLGVLLTALEMLAQASVAALPVVRPGWFGLLLTVAACIGLLSPRGLPARWAWGALLIPLALTHAPRPGSDELWLTALDVGQGTSVVVETAGQVLVYDAGPPLGGNQDAASRVILPYLQARGIRRIDTLVISHGDSDHAGGALTLIRALEVREVVSSLEPDHPIVQAARRHVPCVRDGGWHWGQTRFTWLHPSSATSPAPSASRRAGSNSRSCVLHIDSPAVRVLLAGDIEAPQEQMLLALDPEALAAEVLLVPHHGSLTSSSVAFIDAVNPSWAIFQLAYRSRFGHPHPRVLRRYELRGIAILRSDADGAIQLRFAPGREPRVEAARHSPRRYWRVPVDRLAPGTSDRRR